MKPGNAKMPISNNKILLIEDEGELCLLLNLILDGQGLGVEHVKSIMDANAYLEKRLPALVMLDNRLPDGFGVDYLMVLKSKYPWIKVVLMTGVDMAVADVAFDNGADAFLSKPFTKSALIDTIDMLLYPN
jgi:DNA-binding NtrC family response regulator